MRKLTGNTDIEGSLDKLDKLTQEEARMASAEMLKMTRSIDDKVSGVDDNVKIVAGNVEDVGNKVRAVDDRVQDVGRDVRGDVQDVGNKVQGVDHKVQDIGSDIKDIGSDIKEVSSEIRGVDNKLDEANRSLSLSPAHRSERSDRFTGNQLRDSLFRWLSPPDPSINHNIASKAHHKGTAEWLLQGSIFNQWKSTGSFLWIHGKRAFLFTFTMRQPLIISYLYSGVGEKCRLVRPSSTPSAIVKLT